MQTLKLLTNKVILGAGVILIFVGSLATASHTWFFCHEEKCPEELIRDK